MEVYIIPEQITTKEAVYRIPFDDKKNLERIINQAKHSYKQGICVYIKDNALSFSSLSFFVEMRESRYSHFVVIPLSDVNKVFVGEV